MEECGELTQACSKVLRKQYFENRDYRKLKGKKTLEESKKDLIKEVADVLCMIELMKDQGLIEHKDIIEGIEKKREKLKKIIMDKKLPLEERFKAQQKLSKLPRNSAKIRVMNRCEITGRPHGVYRKLKISRIALRQLGLQGKIPGLVKSSW